MTGGLLGFVVVLVAAVLAIRWAIDELRPFLWLFVVIVLSVGLWRVSSLIRRRW